MSELNIAQEARIALVQMRDYREKALANKAPIATMRYMTNIFTATSRSISVAIAAEKWEVELKKQGARENTKEAGHNGLQQTKHLDNAFHGDAMLGRRAEGSVPGKGYSF